MITPQWSFPSGSRLPKAAVCCRVVFRISCFYDTTLDEHHGFLTPHSVGLGRLSPDTTSVGLGRMSRRASPDTCFCPEMHTSASQLAYGFADVENN